VTEVLNFEFLGGRWKGGWRRGEVEKGKEGKEGKEGRYGMIGRRERGEGWGRRGGRE
jgi:hypothetical protein